MHWDWAVSAGVTEEALFQGEGPENAKALEIIHELSGDNPDQQAVNRVKQAIGKSYDLYAAALDEVMGHA